MPEDETPPEPIGPAKQAPGTTYIDDDGMHVEDGDGNVIAEFRDPYVAAHRSAPIFTTLLAELGEEWAEQPIPFPDDDHMDLLRHLWNIGGADHSASFVGGLYTAGPPLPGTFTVWKDGPVQVRTFEEAQAAWSDEDPGDDQ